MSIDATVAYVETREDGSGTLHLIGRVSHTSRPDGTAGQRHLHFATAPYEVTALNGLNIWGGSGFLMLGDTEIATREGYARISFIEREPFNAAVEEYHRRHRKASHV